MHRTIIAITFALLACLMSSCDVESYETLQDTGNHRVISRNVANGREREIFAGDPSLPASGTYTKGVSMAFPHAVREGAAIVIVRGRERQEIIVTSISTESIGITTASGSSEIREGFPMKNTAHQPIRWSAKDGESIYLYTDDFTRLPESELASIAVVSGASTIAQLSDIEPIAKFPWQDPEVTIPSEGGR